MDTLTMPLPTVKCPVCHSSMSIDVLLADDAPREALLAIIDVHPQGKTFIKPLLHYIGLFAPAKSQLSHTRIAALIGELTPMITAGRIERNGIIHTAPLDYWTDGINAVLNARSAGTLTTPLKSHGYLLEVISKRANASAAKAEQAAHESARKGEARRAEERTRQAERNSAHEQAQAATKSDHRERLAALKQKFIGKGNTQQGLTSITDIAAQLKPATTTPEKE